MPLTPLRRLLNRMVATFLMSFLMQRSKRVLAFQIWPHCSGRAGVCTSRGPTFEWTAKSTLQSPSFSQLRYSSSSLAPIQQIKFDQQPSVILPPDEALNNVDPTKPNKFVITAPYPPTGDQPQAIQRLVHQVSRGDKYSILRGCTGTGKTNVMAHTIAKLGRPTLVLCHNKTLAAQLARELKSCLGKNHVHLFVSYYNHFVPESYNESTNKYTAKKSSINDELDALRHLATRALVQHDDVVIVSSVSCIYGLGMPKSYLEKSLQWTAGKTTLDSLDTVLQAMETTLYAPADAETTDERFRTDDLMRGQYQLTEGPNNATLVLWQPSDMFPSRIDFEQTDEGNLFVSSIGRGQTNGMTPLDDITIFPAKHHVTESEDIFEEALIRIQDELTDRVKELKAQSKHIEADRLSKRVSQDLLLLKETGTCPGVENYSRHMVLRDEGEAPDTLLDYFGYGSGQDWLLMVDESHVALPQLKAMYGGDRSRKERLIKHGYRLPSALDNRPLKESEFWERVTQSVFVSATPAPQEMTLLNDVVDNEPIDMIIRPTYVCDPIIHVRPSKGQLEDLLKEVQSRAQRKERTLAMALTKRDAEDLAGYLFEHGVASTYIHSGLNTHERSNALKSLQSGEIDCLVGVNLLREGLDLPQVSLVAVLKADSEGFLRSEAALLQTIGRAARNINGTAVMYADRVTDSMKQCIDATNGRRKLQLAYNAEHGKEMKSTEGSSVLSIFDLVKDQIQAEQPIEVVQNRKGGNLPRHTLPLAEEGTNVNFNATNEIETDHIPSKPGVYFWKRGEEILYIGKAKKLRSRVKSYLRPGAKHTKRVETMLKKADNIEFVLTPSDRDALILESNLIKHHQPPYNVLLKDDSSYPYICASVGDNYPQFSIAPRRQEGDAASKYKYFGPYPHYSEINSVLYAIEEKYSLRAQCFQARYGEISKADYQALFQQVLSDVFLAPGGEQGVDNSLPEMRNVYEEASQLFASEYNENRDVIAVGKNADDGTLVVLVLQLRDGLIAGRFTYTCELNDTPGEEEEYGDIIHTVLEHSHYPAGEAAATGRYSFFPDEILVQYPLNDQRSLKAAIRAARNAAEPGRKGAKLNVRTAAKRGRRKESDLRALQCAIENAEEIASNKKLTNPEGAAPLTSVDGTATKELAEMLSLERAPKRIECYDISHTQGEAPVASRVVFVDGERAPHLYRRFNIKTVQGIDDYASLEEALERRFRRAWGAGEGELVDKSDPWSLPDLVVIDGGKGQLSAALKGMAKANVYPEGALLGELGQEFELDGSTVSSSTSPLPDGLLNDQRASVPVVALAKRNEEVFSIAGSDPLNDRPDSAGLLLLRALRDESHRFALSAHRKQRSKLAGLSLGR